MAPRRILAVAGWSMVAWVLLTWTATREQIGTGVVLSLALGVALAPLGDVAGPWRPLDPRVLRRLPRLLGTMVTRMVGANLSLARRIWTPSLPIRPGMVVVPTEARTEGGVTTVGVLSSLIVDNQLVDLDVGRAAGGDGDGEERWLLQYHAISVESRDPEENRATINGPLERDLVPLERVGGGSDEERA